MTRKGFMRNEMCMESGHVFGQNIGEIKKFIT